MQFSKTNSCFCLFLKMNWKGAWTWRQEAARTIDWQPTPLASINQHKEENSKPPWQRIRRDGNGRWGMVRRQLECTETEYLVHGVHTEGVCPETVVDRDECQTKTRRRRESSWVEIHSRRKEEQMTTVIMSTRVLWGFDSLFPAVWFRGWPTICSIPLHEFICYLTDCSVNKLSHYWFFPQQFLLFWCN